MLRLPSQRKTEMIAREELYELIWSMPMTKVAEKFSVSGSYMARVCSVLAVPRPERGYWAKLEFGKAQPNLRSLGGVCTDRSLRCTCL